MNSQTTENVLIECGCGCGKSRTRFDRKGRERLFVSGHQNRVPSEKQREHREWLTATYAGGEPWNKGRSYLIGKKTEYAHKGSWRAALMRLHGDVCMRCGWKEAPCDVHHINPKRAGGKYELQNGAILCPNCHRLAEVGTVTIEELFRLKVNAPMLSKAV